MNKKQNKKISTRMTISPSQITPVTNSKSFTPRAPVKFKQYDSQREWSYRLCGCCEDCKECCCAFFCPPCYACSILKKIDDNRCACFPCCWVAIRTKIRTQRKIKGDIPKDCCALMCCPCCAMTQMGREARDTQSLL